MYEERGALGDSDGWPKGGNKKKELSFEVVATQIFFTFSPPFPGEMIQSDEHIFQRGCFNHQLGLVR